MTNVQLSAVAWSGRRGVVGQPSIAERTMGTDATFRAMPTPQERTERRQILFGEWREGTG